MSKSIKRIAISGAGGQIAYSLIFRLASGELLGLDQPVSLQLLEVPEVAPQLKGLEMELEDCSFSFPLLKEVKYGSNADEMFGDADYVFLIGAKPRGAGMERKDLLLDNGAIFTGQGRALDKAASKDALVLVVGNPCNTNCLIAMKQLKRLNPRRFFAMTQLDQNRLAFQLAKKANVDLEAVTNCTVWGNHSATQVPDFVNTRIHGKSALQVIQDRAWCEETLVPQIQKRGAAVIQARGKSSAASAAHAALDAMRALIVPTSPEDWFSTALLSDGNPYGISEDLVFSFPVRSKGDGLIEIVPDLSWDGYLKEMVKQTEQELLEEKAAIHHLL